jgi:hypothetical protein
MLSDMMTATERRVESGCGKVESVKGEVEGDAPDDGFRPPAPISLPP